MAARLFAVLIATAFLTGCGGSPPSDQVEAEINKAVYAANLAMVEGSKEMGEVVSIKIGSWKKETMPQGGPTMFESTWTAKLRFKEPIGCILAEVDGKNIVKVVAEKGDELAFEGICGSVKFDGKWESHANAQNKTGIMGAGAWKPIADKVPDLTMGYPVIVNGMRTQGKFRNQNFDVLSRFKPYVIEGSDEDKKMQAEAAERFQKQQAAQIEQQKQRQAALEAQQQKQKEDQDRIRKENEEKQRLAQEEQKRLAAEAAEKQRLAAEEAKKKAEEAKHARLLTALKPFQSASGAVITAEAGATLGTVILEAPIDDPKLTVSGKAIDLREMPFKEFTVDGSVDDRGAFTLKSSLGGDPVAYAVSADKLASRNGTVIASLSEAERAKLNAIIDLGKRLGNATPAELKLETLDAEAAKTREPQLRLTGLSGSVFYRGRLNPAVAPLFAADLASNKAYAWKNKEVVSIRLAEPAKGSGIFIRGTAAPSTEMIVTINGVHKVTVAAIPKLGDVIIGLPADLEVLDVKLEATGSVSARTIGLVK